MKLFNVTLHNETSRFLPMALFGLTLKALKRGFAVVPSLSPEDYIQERQERTQAGAIEIEVYADGSGLEVAYRGKLYILGVEKAPGAGWGLVVLSQEQQDSGEVCAV